MDTDTSGATATREPARGAEEDRFLLCLVLLLVTLLTFAFADDLPLARLVALALKGVTLLAILWVSRVRRHVLIGMGAVVAAAVVGAVAGVVTGVVDELGLPSVLTASLALAAPVAIVRRLLTHERVHPSTVFGALCLYVLAGLFFASGYAALEAFGGSRFFVQAEAAAPIDFVYFSFVTLATLGYGDLTPATDLGRMLAITQTMLGQLYLVGAVAVLVSNLGRPRRRPASPGRPSVDATR